MSRYASVALWTAYGLLVILVAVQLWAMERAVDEIRELECNLAVVSLVETDIDEGRTAAVIDLLERVCGDEASILVNG